MTNDILQELDKFSDNPRCSPEVEAAIDRNQSTQFREDYPEYYNSAKNWGYISGWLRSMVAPVTRRNLAIAYELLKSKGLMETNDEPEVTHRTIKPTKAEQGITNVYAEPKKNFSHEGLAENSLLREKPERLNELASDVLARRQAADADNRALSGAPGQPVSKTFEQKYKQSLGRTQRTFEDGKPPRWAEARMVVREHRQDLKPDSTAFTAEVHAQLARWSKGEE